MLSKAARAGLYQTLEIRTEPWENLQLQQHLSHQATMHVGQAMSESQEEEIYAVTYGQFSALLLLLPLEDRQDLRFKHIKNDSATNKLLNVCVTEK